LGSSGPRYPVRDEDLAQLSPFVRRHLCTAATGSCCLASPAAFAYCVTRTPKTTTGVAPRRRPGELPRPPPIAARGRSLPLNGLAGVAVAGWTAAGELAAPRPPRGFRSLPQHRKSLAVVRVAIPWGISATRPDAASSRRNVAGIRTEFVPLGGPAVITERRRRSGSRDREREIMSFTGQPAVSLSQPCFRPRWPGG
jgi:hypothetical protein